MGFRYISVLNVAVQYRRMADVLICDVEYVIIHGVGLVAFNQTTGFTVFKLKDSSVSVLTHWHSGFN